MDAVQQSPAQAPKGTGSWGAVGTEQGRFPGEGKGCLSQSWKDKWALSREEGCVHMGPGGWPPGVHRRSVVSPGPRWTGREPGR